MVQFSGLGNQARILRAGLAGGPGAPLLKTGYPEQESQGTVFAKFGVRGTGEGPVGRVRGAGSRGQGQEGRVLQAGV